MKNRELSLEFSIVIAVLIDTQANLRPEDEIGWVDGEKWLERRCEEEDGVDKENGVEGTKNRRRPLGRLCP
ncbi:hypothetical protein QYF36_012143 [Acer negundo]|nr:hypothetical protein QYF36_012143 [Acer negundo]